MSYAPLANILKKTVRGVRKFVIRDYNEIEELQSSVKDIGSFVEKSKNKIVYEIESALMKVKPDFPVKKKIENNLADFWLIDVIDSPLNFSRANENFGVNISLFEKNIIKTNLFYNPIKDDFFFYEKGTGAFKNETRIRVSNKKKKEESLVSIYNNRRVSNVIQESLIKKFLTESFFSQVESGSYYCDLSNLCCGKIDCIIFIDPSNEIIQINDFVIGSAGGITHKLEIDKTKIFISGNKYIDKMVLEMIENNIR